VGPNPSSIRADPAYVTATPRVRAEQLPGERHQHEFAILEGDHPPPLGGEGRENDEVAAVLEDIGGIGGVRGECVLARDRDRVIDDGGWRGDRGTRHRETQDTSNDGKRNLMAFMVPPSNPHVWKPSEPLGPSAGRTRESARRFLSG
jgi:hypothetical protein